MVRGKSRQSSKEGGECEGREAGRRDDGFPLASSPIVTSGFNEAMLACRDFPSSPSRPPPSFHTSLPPSHLPTISYPVLYKHIEALNRLINEDPARIVVQNKRGRIMQAAEAVEKVRIRLYRNGLLVKRGPFRHTNTNTYASFIAGTWLIAVHKQTLTHTHTKSLFNSTTYYHSHYSPICFGPLQT